MTLFLQLTGVVFALCMMFLTFMHFKRKEFLLSDFIIWLFVWVGFIVVVIVPQSVKFLFQSLAINGALWFITISAIIFLTILVFYLHFTVRKNQKKLEQIVKEFAVMHVKEEHKK